jgi:ribosomal protein uL24
VSRYSAHSPRRQRRALYTADTFERRRRMAVLLSRELRGRFHQRSVPIRKGDTVRVLDGSFKGREERVAKVDRRAYSITLDNVTLKTADEKMKPLGLRPGHLVITRLNLSDAWRRRSLRIRDEDTSAEERGEAPTEEETEVATPAEPETQATEASAVETAPAVEPSDGEDTAAEEKAEPTPSKPATRRRTRSKAASEDAPPAEDA